MFLKDDPELLTVDVGGTLAADPGTIKSGDRMAAVTLFQRLGGLMQKLAERSRVKLANVMAVWLVESSGRPFVPSRAPIRLEVHLLFDNWGKQTRQEFNQNFRFGGHNNHPGKRWENHEYRPGTGSVFAAVHHNQNSEYAAFALARMLAGDEGAMRSTTIGGPQILMANASLLGYRTAPEMYAAFQSSERSQVLGFFDFCRNLSAPHPGDLCRYLAAGDWNNFARYYNGAGQIEAYGDQLREQSRVAQSLLAA